MRDALHLALLVAAAIGSAGAARADWRDPIGGATAVLPAQFEPDDGTLTVHISPRRAPAPPDGGAAPFHWSQPLVDRHLGAGERFAPLGIGLQEAIGRIEPIYDPTLLDGPNDLVPMHVSAGSAETRDLFGDHWRLASADANVDADARPLAVAWTAAAAPRPCSAYRVRRRHDWHEAALSATTAADCRAILARQARSFADTSPLPVAVAAPPIPVFAAPEPGSRMTSADFWTAQRARIASIHAHLGRKWIGGAKPSATRPVRNASN